MKRQCCSRNCPLGSVIANIDYGKAAWSIAQHWHHFLSKLYPPRYCPANLQVFARAMLITVGVTINWKGMQRSRFSGNHRQTLLWEIIPLSRLRNYQISSSQNNIKHSVSVLNTKYPLKNQLLQAPKRFACYSISYRKQEVRAIIGRKA